MSSTLRLQNIFKRYNEQDASVLSDISLQVEEGEFIALLGPSGSGKSTLLHIAGLLDKADQGHVIICEENTTHMPDYKKTQLRLSTIGFVYQYHHLLQEFTALENVMLPQLYAGCRKAKAKLNAIELLEQLGLENKYNAYASELSGGQKQRVAIARALANKPKILLADEPTGNLDPDTAEMVFNDLVEIMKTTKMSAIIATHNYTLALKMQRQYLIHEGRLVKA